MTGRPLRPIPGELRDMDELLDVWPDARPMLVQLRATIEAQRQEIAALKRERECLRVAYDEAMARLDERAAAKEWNAI